jgi:predicted ABC-type ATPase
MTPARPRLRMFAGPNGSGKSTIKSVIAPSLLGVYVNPDEIEKEIRQSDFLNLNAYSI